MSFGLLGPSSPYPEPLHTKSFMGRTANPVGVSIDQVSRCNMSSCSAVEQGMECVPINLIGFMVGALVGTISILLGAHISR